MPVKLGAERPPIRATTFEVACGDGSDPKQERTESTQSQEIEIVERSCVPQTPLPGSAGDTSTKVVKVPTVERPAQPGAGVDLKTVVKKTSGCLSSVVLDTETLPSCVKCSTSRVKLEEDIPSRKHAKEEVWKNEDSSQLPSEIAISAEAEAAKCFQVSLDCRKTSMFVLLAIPKLWPGPAVSQATETACLSPL